MDESVPVASEPAVDVAATEGTLTAVLVHLQAEEAALTAEYEGRLADLRARRAAVEMAMRLARGLTAPTSAADADAERCPRRPRHPASAGRGG